MTQTKQETIVEEIIERQIGIHRSQEDAVKAQVGAKYRGIGCVTIKNPGEKREGHFITDEEGLEISYEFTNDRSYWHFDRMKQGWTLQDMERFRRNGSYRPPKDQKEFVGNVHEYEYPINETANLGRRILNGERVGPLEHELLSDIDGSIAQELGAHMIAVHKYVTETPEKSA